MIDPLGRQWHSHNSRQAPVSAWPLTSFPVFLGPGLVMTPRRFQVGIDIAADQRRIALRGVPEAAPAARLEEEGYARRQH